MDILEFAKDDIKKDYKGTLKKLAELHQSNMVQFPLKDLRFLLTHPVQTIIVFFLI